jgi:hypothetical protein
MTRVDQSKRPDQPETALWIEKGDGSGEVCLIFGTWLFSLVEELKLRNKIRNAVLRPAPDRREGTREARVTTKSPVVPVGVSQHQLQCPGICLARTAPDIMDHRAEHGACFPRAKRPRIGMGGGRRRLDIPPIQKPTNRELIPPQDLDIEILVLARFFSQKEIECPPSGNPSGDRERGEQHRDLVYRPWLPHAKGGWMVLHALPFCFRFKTPASSYHFSHQCGCPAQHFLGFSQPRLRGQTGNDERFTCLL